MIIRGTPKNKNFIKVNNRLSNILNENGFYPKYIDSDYIYFIKNEDIINIIKENANSEELKWLKIN